MLKKFLHWMGAMMLAALPVFSAGISVSAADPLLDSFRSPPPAARARCWWHWMDNFITREGITKDLEAMKRAGLGGATILDIACFSDIKGDVKCLSPEWFAMVNHAVLEAKRLGLDLSVANCPGWSSSGGPWIRPENAMKNLGWTETRVRGGQHVETVLPKIPAPKGYVKDVAVIAFPAIPGDQYDFWNNVAKTTILHDPGLQLPKTPQNVKYSYDPAILADGKWFTQMLFNPKLSQQPQGIIIELKVPQNMASFAVAVSGPPWQNKAQYRISVSDDGKQWKEHCLTAFIPIGAGLESFPPVTAKFFKIEPVKVGNDNWLPVSGLTLSPAVRIPQYSYKTFAKHETFDKFPKFAQDTRECPAGCAVELSRALVLTDRMDANGKLVWDAPAGEWTVMRFALYTRNSGNHPANPEGRGLECDKMSKAGVDAAWSGMMKPIIEKAKASGAGDVVKYTLIDSYEVGPQNWTENMVAEFKELRGYDPTPYLPAMSGRYVKDSETSERFLEDIRRTVSDLYARWYGDYFRKVTNADGVRFELEPYGGPFDDLMQGRAADVAMGEFWYNAHNPGVGNSRLASNVADVNGKKYVQTETFTSGRRSAAWSSYPAKHKLQGDHAFAEGVNRFVFHSYAHQPFNTTGAGITMGKWGFHFNRHNTLWEFYPGWLDYIGRAQFMLQQGTTVADVLYVTKEDTPVTPDFQPGTPFGYNFNAIDARTFISEVTADDGCARLKNGRRYKVIVLPHARNISPELLDKAKTLAEAGAEVLLSEPPLRAFGLRGFPAADAKVKELTAALWGEKGKAQALGKGHTWYGVEPEAILKAIAMQPDFQLRDNKNRPVQPGTPDKKEIVFLHRRLADREVYFVANISQTTPLWNFTGVFRTTGAVEFWDAEDGSVRPAAVWKAENGLTRVPLSLPQGKSIFVVFRKGVAPQPHLEESPLPEIQPMQRLQVQKADWRAAGTAAGSDVTALVRGMIKGGTTLAVTVNAENLGGDPMPGKPKELHLVYSVDGKTQEKTIPEWKNMTLTAPASAPRTTAEAPELRVDNGKVLMISAEGAPQAQEIAQGWTATFQENRGAPSGEYAFPQGLKSLALCPEDGVKYFSGTATYRNRFTIDGKNLAPDTEVSLDLGAVHEVARVKLNGRDLGFVWHAPFRLPVTSMLKAGENTLEVQVANRWINRLIGDEQTPAVGEWRKDDILLMAKMPEGFKDGRLPAGKFAFSTARPYTKNDKLQPSGLAGPVRLLFRTVREIPAVR